MLASVIKFFMISTLEMISFGYFEGVVVIVADMIVSYRYSFALPKSVFIFSIRVSVSYLEMASSSNVLGTIHKVRTPGKVRGPLSCSSDVLLAHCANTCVASSKSSRMYKSLFPVVPLVPWYEMPLLNDFLSATSCSFSGGSTHSEETFDN